MKCCRLTFQRNCRLPDGSGARGVREGLWRSWRKARDVFCDRCSRVGGVGVIRRGPYRVDGQRGACGGGGPDDAVLPAAADEVSAAIAALFSGQAQEFQALGAQAAAFHEQFVQALRGAGGAYAAAEAANASPLAGRAAATYWV